MPGDHRDAPIPIAILDFAMAAQCLATRDALTTSVDLARLVDRRGVARY